jgi:hypothetical protein
MKTDVKKCMAPDLPAHIPWEYTLAPPACFLPHVISLPRLLSRSRSFPDAEVPFPASNTLAPLELATLPRQHPHADCASASALSLAPKWPRANSAALAEGAAGQRRCCTRQRRFQQQPPRTSTPACLALILRCHSRRSRSRCASMPQPMSAPPRSVLSESSLATSPVPGTHSGTSAVPRRRCSPTTSLARIALPIIPRPSPPPSKLTLALRASPARHELAHEHNQQVFVGRARRR